MLSLLLVSEFAEACTPRSANRWARTVGVRRWKPKLLWGGASVPIVASGAIPLAESSSGAGATTTMTPGQSRDSDGVEAGNASDAYAPEPSDIRNRVGAKSDLRTADQPAPKYADLARRVWEEKWEAPRGRK